MNSIKINTAVIVAVCLGCGIFGFVNGINYDRKYWRDKDIQRDVFEQFLDIVNEANGYEGEIYYYG